MHEPDELLRLVWVCPKTSKYTAHTRYGKWQRGLLAGCNLALALDDPATQGVMVRLLQELTADPTVYLACDGPEEHPFRVCYGNNQCFPYFHGWHETAAGALKMAVILAYETISKAEGQ
jgi:hypothetical protein